MGGPMKVAIIGGAGRMGRWFTNCLLKDGKEVTITDRDDTKLQEAGQQLGVKVATNIEAVKNADLVLLSVPIDSFEEVVREICPYTRPEQIIIDITSVKVLPVETMHKHIKIGLVLGAHPMFGPGASGIRGHNFILTPTNEKETAVAQKVERYLEVKGAKTTLMTPYEHDKMMAIVLGLSHFIAIVSADTLLSFDTFRQTRFIGGITYKMLLTLVESVISEAPELYASLQMSLPNMAEIEKLFQRKVKTWLNLVRNKDRQKFIERMDSLKAKIKERDPDFGKAYENVYKLVANL
jgi:prephenate dehydrogenase